MLMLDVSRILHSRSLAQPGGFTVYRKSGAWVAGRFVPQETQMTIQGVVTACKPKDLVQVPEGDRATAVMCFHSPEQIYTTRNEGTSDEIVWRGERYRILSVIPWGDFGYWKALGVRMVSD